MRYTDDFRATACTALQAAGYPDKKGALTKVSGELGVPHPTLSRWYNEKRNPPPKELVQEKKADLAELLKKEVEAALGAMPNARDHASYQQLATTIAIFIDKLQLLQGRPTEIVNTTIEERANRISAIFDTARTRRDRQSSTVQ